MLRAPKDLYLDDRMEVPTLGIVLEGLCLAIGCANEAKFLTEVQKLNGFAIFY